VVSAVTVRRSPPAAVRQRQEQGRFASRLKERSLERFDPNRQKLVETYLPAAASNGDKLRGKKNGPYAKAVVPTAIDWKEPATRSGPDLAGAGDAIARIPADGPFSIPIARVEDRYLEYVVLTADGRQLNGMLGRRKNRRQPDAGGPGRKAIGHSARATIEQIKSSGKSLMPEGVGKGTCRRLRWAIFWPYLRGSTPAAKTIARQSAGGSQAFQRRRLDSPTGDQMPVSMDQRLCWKRKVPQSRLVEQPGRPCGVDL